MIDPSRLKLVHTLLDMQVAESRKSISMLGSDIRYHEGRIHGLQLAMGKIELMLEQVGQPIKNENKN